MINFNFFLKSMFKIKKKRGKTILKEQKIRFGGPLIYIERKEFMVFEIYFLF